MTSSWPGSGSRNLSTFVDAVCPKSGPVKRWDGAARTSKNWDGLGMDQELWLRNGNCHVYLYGKGQSKRGPSFKIPFKELLANKCFPLIERFLVTEGPGPRTPRQLEKWGTDPKRIVEMYIPPPSTANKDQGFVYHVATRNFFAWVFRRSMVGEHLGQALVGLLYSMHEFRADVKDNVKDMVDYMDEEGYLDVADQPNHALAVLYLAETFHMKDLYIRAFAHCVGMNDQLCVNPEYQQLNLTTKKLIRQAKNDLDSRLDAANDMLSGFLGDELSESHLGVPPGLRAHLERFRSFLLSYYTTRFSYYPPRVFKPSLCNTMRDDFEALYKLLADDSYSASECLPSVACGGICTLQLVQMFDAKHGYESLDNPLPLLPQFNQKSSSRRMPWRARIERLLPDQKLLAHTALIKASNWRDKVFHNDLVKAYRKFEEDSVYTAAKADKQEKVSLVDARKVRWILIYATCQVLRSVTDIPDEVFDAGEAPYHVAISTKYLPPWSETAIDFGNLVRRQTELAVQTSPSIYWADSAGTVDNSGKIEIKPDIDYFALTHQELTPTERTRPGLASSVMTSTPPTRSNSVARGLSRNGTIRRSMRMFKPAAAERPQEAMALSKPPYHQIVVQGYGNGLNYLSLESGSQTVETVETVETTETTTTPLWAVRNNSTLSHSGSSGQASAPGSTDSGDTLESTIVTPTTLTGFSNYALQPESKPSRSQKRDVVSMLLGPSRTNSSNGNSIKRPVSSAMPGSRASSNMNFDGNGANNYSDIYEQLVDEQRQSFFSGEGDASVSLKRTSQQPRFVVDDDWAAMQAFMDGSETPTDGDKRDVKPAWEQYADLGGLTEMRSSVAV